jgi:hypothetical protein
MMDKKTNVVLLLLDLSAAFDTINHDLLIKKLTKLYAAIAALKGQWPFLTFLAVLDSKNATIGGLSSL